MQAYEVDYAIIGSGFGGAVAALRLIPPAHTAHAANAHAAAESAV